MGPHCQRARDEIESGQEPTVAKDWFAKKLTQADMYDFAPIHKAKQELEANGWAPSKADESRVQNVQVVQNVKIAAAPRRAYHRVSDVGWSYARLKQLAQMKGSRL